MTSLPPAFAAAPLTVEERLSLLEKNLAAVQKENTELKTQLGWDAKTPLAVAKPAGKENKIKLGGYFQGHYESGGAPDARFNNIEDRALIRRARISVAGSFLENFDFKIEGDFGANSLSEKTNYTAQLTDVFVNWNRYSFANLKVGQFKTPYGYEQLISDTKILTIERSLPNDRLTDGRQIGLALWGDLVTNRLSYNVGVFNGNSVNNSYNDNERYRWAGRLSGVAFDGKLFKHDARLALGLNAVTSDDKGVARSGFGFSGNSFTGRRVVWGVDAQAKWWLFGVEGEYLHSEFSPTVGASFGAQGWSVAASAEVWPKHLQAVAKYESFDPNCNVAGNTSDVWTIGANYFFKGDDLKLSLNYLLGNPAGAADHQGRFIASMQVIF